MRHAAPQKIKQVWIGLMVAIVLPAIAAQAQTFLTVPLNLSATGHAVIPSMAVGPDADINVVWLDSGAILFRRSTNGGQTFSATMVVATTFLPSQASQPQIAVNAAGVYVAWAGPGDVYFSTLASGSSTWTTPINVSSGKGITPGSAPPVPHMAVDPNGGVDVVWGQSGAYFARFSAGTFSAGVQLTASAMASQSPRIAINAAGHVFVVWENAASCPTITFARSTTGGASFATYSVADDLTVNGQPVTGCTSDVQIGVRTDNTVWLLWANENPNIQDLILTYAVDQDPFTANGSNSFPELNFQNLSNAASHVPKIAIDANGNVNVAWMADVSQSDPRQVVTFTRSTAPEQGGTFCGGPNDPQCPTPPILSVAQNPGIGFPQITTESSGAVDIVWQQASASNPGGAYDIVLARSTDGVIFTSTTLDSAPTTQSATAQIAADGTGNVYATWDGNSGGSGDILLNGDSAGLHVAAQFSISGIKLSASPLSAVINVGGSASFNLSLSSANAVPGNVTLSCGGAPAGVSCAFSPNPVSMAANSSASTMLTVGVTVKPSTGFVTRGPGVGSHPNVLAVTGWSVFAFSLLAGILAFSMSAYLPRYIRSLALAAALAAAAVGMSSCGGSTQSGGGGGGGGSFTFPLTLQGQANSGSSILQTISITVP